MLDCGGCRHPCTHISADWFPPSSVHYCRPEILWFIPYLSELSEGKYPPECRETGYVGSGGRKGHSAPYEVAVGIHGEITYRLDRTGKDGALLVAQVIAELDLHPDAEQALRYVTGWRRKTLSYARWCRNGRYWVKLHKTKTQTS